MTHSTCQVLPLSLSGQRQPTIRFPSWHSIFTLITLFMYFVSTKEIDTLSTRYRASCLMTIVASENKPFCGRKRRRGAIDEEHSTIAAISSKSSWKRAKRLFQSQQKANAAYWDSLSKLWLTRRALKELNRRNKQTISSVRTEIIRRSSRSEESTTLENCSSSLKRFVRHDDSDLRDLRGVSSA